MISIYYKMYIFIRSDYCDKNCYICNISLWNIDIKYTEIDDMFLCLKCWDKIDKIMLKKRNNEIKQIIENNKNELNKLQKDEENK